jgi:hypothetical protein
MSRTYNRDTIRWDQTLLDMLVAENMATAYETALGTIYVVKQPEGGSVKVTPEQIISADEKARLNELADITIIEVIEHQSEQEARTGTSWVSSAEKDEILGYFGI